MFLKISMLTVSLLLLLELPIKAYAETGQEKKKTLSIHQRIAACWENEKEQFKDWPTNCNAVCAECHLDNVSVDDLGPKVDETYVVLYPNTYDNWSKLSDYQQSCRNCHEIITDIESEDNHPIFVNMLSDESEKRFNHLDETDLKLSNGTVLCTTCHNPHSVKPSQLRIANNSSRLCTECHIL